MKTRLPYAALLAAALVAAAGCRTARAPYAAPPTAGAPALDREAAARVLVLVQADSDPRTSPPWREKADRAADAIAAALADAGFRVTRGSLRFGVRVTVGAPVRGPDLAVVADANGKVLERWDANGDGWGPGELAELGRAVRQWLERSDAVAALAGVAVPRAAAAAAPGPAAPGTPPADRAAGAGPAASPANGGAASPGATPAEPARPPAPVRRLVVLDFRGAAPAPVLILLADQARAAAAEAGRASGTTVLTRDAVEAEWRARGRPAGPCADGGCDREAARAAGADRVVTGEVTAVGDARVLVLKLVDVATGTLVASTQAQASGDLALVEAARPAAAALFR